MRCGRSPLVRGGCDRATGVGELRAQDDRSCDSYAIRYAKEEDATPICEVLIRSIREVCGPDYGNDEALLEKWCRNKKPEIVKTWLADPSNITIVALTEEDKIVGVGQVHLSGEIRICYVLPEALRRGVGRALLQRLEKEARRLGLSRLVLTSTSTALRFYEHFGYRQSNSREPRGPGWQYPMAKEL